MPLHSCHYTVSHTHKKKAKKKGGDGLPDVPFLGGQPELLRGHRCGHRGCARRLALRCPLCVCVLACFALSSLGRVHGHRGGVSRTIDPWSLTLPLQTLTLHVLNVRSYQHDRHG